jgi:hypothetical protein
MFRSKNARSLSLNQTIANVRAVFGSVQRARLDFALNERLKAGDAEFQGLAGMTREIAI